MSKIRLCAAALALTLLAGCAVGAEREQRESFVEQTALEEVCIEEELVALAGAPALSTLREIVEDTDDNAQARISAARSDHEYSMKLTETTDILSRLDELEAAMGGEHG